MEFRSWMTYTIVLLIFDCHVASCCRNFALNKPASQSSTMAYNNFNWTADKAVDGNSDGSDPNEIRTCSGTTRRLENHTWEVDIGFLIIVKTITVYERVGEDQLSGFQVFIGNDSRSFIGNNPLNKVPSSNNKKHIFRANDALARFVSVLRENKTILTICEVEVDGDCLDGMYSEFCNHTCGKCFEGSPCNKDTGQCLCGCEQGWREILCDKECDSGTYGRGCTDTCGKCLYGTNSCSKTDGQCMYGCENGWSGYTCKMVSAENQTQSCPDIDASAIGGSVGGICVVGIIINIITILVLKKRMKKYTSDSKREMNVHNLETSTGNDNSRARIEIADALYEELQDRRRISSSTYSKIIEIEKMNPIKTLERDLK